jgi:hypothetical protein
MDLRILYDTVQLQSPAGDVSSVMGDAAEAPAGHFSRFSFLGDPSRSDFHNQSLSCLTVARHTS